MAKVFNKYAGTSDVIYENMNNPFDKHRGPPGRGRRYAAHHDMSVYCHHIDDNLTKLPHSDDLHAQGI